ncbi:DNA-binding transcriptional regulator, FrmR family [Faunimonas pinastri]|uniref:DNA-binding transcriptional regulator, FrmR family n=1 Tax=Faunimonas pinastri TaxID=1855383 RepID=A0A1H9LFD4_9HYPH|nr:DNA-binding transcriptional regulator, FrmR family [Faunimonas pinastri]
MADSELKDGRIYLRRTDEERKPILQRLNRIEGQVRGLRAMIEEDRYCQDEVQQINAVTAALREVALIIISQHVSEGIELASQGADNSEAIHDVMSVLRSAMRFKE